MPMIEGVAYWACVQKPNVNYDPKWTIQVAIDKAQYKALVAAMEEFSDNPKATLQKIEWDDEKGGYMVRLEQRCERADGTPNERPRVVDAAGEPTAALIGNGSDVKVLYRIYKSVYKGKEYIKLGLKAVKVINLVAYGDSDEDEFFKPEDGAVKKGKPEVEKEEDFDDDL